MEQRGKSHSIKLIFNTSVNIVVISDEKDQLSPTSKWVQINLAFGDLHVYN